MCVGVRRRGRARGRHAGDGDAGRVQRGGGARARHAHLRRLHALRRLARVRRAHARRRLLLRCAPHAHTRHTTTTTCPHAHSYTPHAYISL